MQAMWFAFGALRNIPTLALRGAHSDLLSAPTFERMQREHRRMVAVTVPNRGHPPQLDEPQSMEAIERFLSSVRMTRARLRGARACVQTSVGRLPNSHAVLRSVMWPLRQPVREGEQSLIKCS